MGSSSPERQAPAETAGAHALAGAEQAIRPTACRENIPDPGERDRPSGREQETHAFPRPCVTVPRRSEGPGATKASARPGGREAPAGGGAGAGRGALGPRLAWDQRDAVAGAMAPARMRKVRAG